MKKLRFYLLIEDQEKESEVRIDGDVETFRELVKALFAEVAAQQPLAQPTAGTFRQKSKSKSSASSVKSAGSPSGG